MAINGLILKAQCVMFITGIFIIIFIITSDLSLFLESTKVFM